MFVRLLDILMIGCAPGRSAAVFAWALILLLLPSDTSAGLDIKQVEVGFGGRFAAGAWTPLRFELENQADGERPARDFQGHVEVRVADFQGASVVYRQPIELPRQSLKLVEFSVMLASAGPIVVDLIDDRGVSRLRREVPLPRTSSTYATMRHSLYVVPTVLVLTAPTDSGVLPLTLSSSAASVVPIAHEALPYDYRGYDGVRLLVVRGQLTGRLRPEQLLALDRWIELGGRLAVVTPRAHREIAADPWLMDRLPADPADVMELGLADLASGSGPAMALMTRWAESPPGSDVLWRTPAGAAAVVGRRGDGAVYALALDPLAFGAVELETPAGRRLTALIESLVMAPGREDVRARHLWSTADIDPHFQNVMLLPNLWIVTLLIVAFVLIVGPLNFMILRQRRRLELAWATIPGLSILFFFAVYAYGAMAKGGDQHFASSDILHLAPGSPTALLLSSQVQFSPRRDRYRLTPPEGGIALPLLYYYDDPSNPNAFNLMSRLGYGGAGHAPAPIGLLPAFVRDAAGPGGALVSPVDQWKMQFYQTEAPLTINGAMTGRVRLLEREGVQLDFRNDTDFDLADAVLYLGEEEYPVGRVPPGEAVSLELRRNVQPPSRSGRPSPRAAPNDPFTASADLSIRQGGVQAYPIFRTQNPQRRARLMGRIDAWESPVVIEPTPDAAKTAALVELALPVEWEASRVFSTADRLRRQVYAVDSLNTQFFDAPDQFCNLRDSSVEVLIGRAWDGLPAQFRGGTLLVTYVPSSESLSISVFDYEQSRWTQVLDPAQGSAVTPGMEQVFDLRIRDSWINPIEPMLRVRLASVPQSTSGVPITPGKIFSGRYGVAIRNVDAVMHLAPASDGDAAI